jgi:hypothetical protein
LEIITVMSEAVGNATSLITESPNSTTNSEHTAVNVVAIFTALSALRKSLQWPL